MCGYIDRRRLRQRIARNAHQSNAALGDRRLNSESTHCGCLNCGVSRFTIVAAIPENPLRMCFLKVFGPEEPCWHLASDRENRRPIPMGVVEPLNQVQITRTTRFMAFSGCC